MWYVPTCAIAVVFKSSCQVTASMFKPQSPNVILSKATRSSSKKRCDPVAINARKVALSFSRAGSAVRIVDQQEDFFIGRSRRFQENEQLIRRVQRAGDHRVLVGRIAARSWPYAVPIQPMNRPV
jgi:hypothetical protein